MTAIYRKPLSRRTVLRGAGAAIALPLLDAMLTRDAMGRDSIYEPLSRTSVSPTPRSIFCYVPNGVNIAKWVPPASGTNYVLSPTLAELKEHRDDFTVISGLGHPNSTGGHTGADTWLTGADLKAVPGKDYSNTISIDQVIAERVGTETRFPSLQLSDGSGTGSALHSHTLSFDRNGTPLPAENSPKRLFDRLFVPSDAASRAENLKRFAEKRSILDAVSEDARKLGLQLGKGDQAKLDEYLGAVRETEIRVQRAVNWVDVPKPSIDSKHLQLGSQPRNAHDRTMWIDVMLEISYLAFATDLTRVITFEWSREAGGFGPGGENHHELSHHGGDAGMLNKLAKIDAGFLKRLGRFLTFLKRTEEGGRTMLDHTMVVYGSGMNSGTRGGHSPKNLPLLVAGGNQWGLKHGQHLAYDPSGHPPLSNVLLTVAAKMGVESTRFQDSTGILEGLV